MRRFLVREPELREGATVALDEEESAHAARVLRLRPGDEVAVFGGRDEYEFAGTIEESGPRRTTVRLGARRLATPEPPVEITLAFGLSKQRATGLIVQKAVELGASRLRPFLCERAVPRVEPGSLGPVDKWRRMVRDATKQCGRARLCSIEPPVEWPALLRGTPDDAARIVCWEEGRGAGATLSDRLAASGIGPDRPLVLAIGPEGGLTPEEVEQARTRGWEVCSLGARTLRAETAAVAALTAVLCAAGEL